MPLCHSLAFACYSADEKRPQSRSASWDLLRGRGSRPSSVIGGSGTNTPAGGRSGSATPRVEWEGFDFNTANSSVEQLRFAEGDVGTGKVSSWLKLVLSFI